MKIALIQTALFWKEVDKNLLQFSEKIAKIDADTDLVILPEMFATGFAMQPQETAENMDGAAVQWLKENSVNFAICGSLAIQENGNYYNRFIWCENREIKYTYDKKHLFSYASEHTVFTAGNEILLFDYKGFKIAPFICYDLRFPVWIRRVASKADLLIFVANWPTRRVHAWKTLLQARAIENLAYVAGVNRIGEDGNGIAHSGQSAVIDYCGDCLCSAADIEVVLYANLEKEALINFREQFPALEDADNFELI